MRSLTVHGMCLFMICGVAACHTSTVAAPPPATFEAAAPTPTFQPVLAKVVGVDASIERTETVLSPLYEGACGPAHVFAIGGKPALVFQQSVVMLAEDEVRVLYRSTPQVLQTGGPQPSYLSRVGGVDEAHAWIEYRAPTRGGDTTGLPLFAAKKWGSGPSRSSADFGVGYRLENFIEHPDGSLWAFGQHDIYSVAGEPDRKTFAWSKDGDFEKRSVPGADMEHGLRLGNGEVVAAARSKGNKPTLRRWSPKTPVDDLVAEGGAASNLATTVRVGTDRVVLAAPGAAVSTIAFYTYVGGALSPSTLNARIQSMQSWAVMANDDLYVAGQSGGLWIEHKDGSSEQETLPEAGTLLPDAGTPWFIAKSGALYARGANAWNRIALADGPWSAATHPPSRVEWVRVIEGTAFVSVVRTDVAFGSKKPREVRTLYSSRKASPVLRCGAPFDNDELGALPLPSTEACTTTVVTAGRDEKRMLAALKGNAALGASLQVASFEGTLPGTTASPKRSVLAVRATSPAVADELMKRLAPLGAERLCSPISAKERMFDVKAGTLQ
jgi:hypothetical protein